MSTELAVRHDPLDAIDRAPLLADSTKLKYRQTLARYLATGANLTDAAALARHATTLPKSGRSFLKAAVRLHTDDLATALKAQATPENVDQVQAALCRIEALQGAVQVRQSNGTKAHTWLTQAEVKQLLDSCGSDIVGQRDRLVLGLLVAAGLRREEAVNLCFEDVKLQPVAGKIRTVLAVKGKGARDRVVPISHRLANAIDEWAKVTGGQGCILRSLGMNRQPGDCISAQGIIGIVRKRGRRIGKMGLAPHDLRRTYAQLGHEAGIPITQIAKLLGHASVKTTEKYLNLDLDLELPQTEHGFDLLLPRTSPPAQVALYELERFLALVM